MNEVNAKLKSCAKCGKVFTHAPIEDEDDFGMVWIYLYGLPRPTLAR